MKIVRPGDPDYDKDRQICNARFNYKPWAIYYCENGTEVANAMADARQADKPVRIRSGGHQHEGMCTGDDVTLIDLSCIKSIDFSDSKSVQIGAGAYLKDVYAELWTHGLLFPGGACGDVHVGGLTQGGGWGLVSRKFGLTCDSLIGAEIVTAAGDVCQIPRPGHPEDAQLLQALRGGGGGNFCIVTKFIFARHPWEQWYTDLTLKWSDLTLPGPNLERFVKHWADAFPNLADDGLTTFLRIGAVDSATADRIVIGGRYLGTVYETQDKMKELLGSLPLPYEADYQSSPAPRKATDDVQPLEAGEMAFLRRRLGTVPEYQPGPAMLGATLPPGQVDLTTTCAGVPIRHKISSGFANPTLDATAVRTLVGLIRETRVDPRARQYVSLHCLGGGIRKERAPSSFVFRDREVLLQYQAWWQPDAPGLDHICIPWVENVRDKMNPYTDGAFINFVDAQIPLGDYYKSTGRQDAMPFLRKVKKDWDHNNVFKFELSIPPA